MRRSIDLWIAFGLFAFALAVRAFTLLAHPFDGLYGQDPYAYYDYAAALRPALLNGQAPPPFFWPLGYPLHVVAASWIMGMNSQAAQLVSAVAGALIAPLTFALAREVLWKPDPAQARRVGIVAGLIVATAGQLLISSLSIMSDATGLAWATTSGWLTLRYARTLRPALLALAAFTLAIAVITRWVFGLLALPWAGCVLLAWRRAPRSIGFGRALALASIAVIVGGAVVGAQLLSGDSHTGDLQVVSWNPANALRSEVVNSDGTFRYSLPIGVFYLIRPLFHPSFIFPLLAPLWLVGLGSLLSKPAGGHPDARPSERHRDAVLRFFRQESGSSNRVDSAARVLLIGWPWIVYVFLAGIAWQSDRFLLTLFPPLAVWVGLGFNRVWETRPHWRRGLSLFTLVALAGALLWSLRTAGDFVERNKNADLARAQHVAAQLPGGAQVITFGVTLTLQHYTDLDAIEIYHETPASLEARVCGSDTAYLYLDVANIEGQWTGLAPEANYRWLREGPGLEMIDQFQGFTLFKVRGDCA
ncbi:MAG TPA: hypothetical protein VJG32_17375 [Anaerolineae bacterium]|nr:hypothetical protein [Anaerolineae bacterium]